MNTSYLLNQDGGLFLLQSGGELIISSPVVSEKVRIVAKDQAGVSLGEFETFRDLTFGKKLNNYSDAKFSVPVNNSKLTDLIALRENSIAIYNKLVYEDGNPSNILVWAGEQIDTDSKLEDDGNNWLELHSSTWLERFLQRLTTFERIYAGMDAGQIAWSLIDESQRGVKNTGFHSPNGSYSGGDFTTPDNAFTADESYATVSLISKTQYWKDFDLNIPAGSVINGIEIKIKGKAAVSNTTITVGAKSASAGVGAGSTVTLGTANAEYTVGGPTSLFSLAWVATDFASTNPLLFITTLVNAVQVSIDQVQLKVYYTVNDSDFDYGITQGTIEATTNRDRTYHNDIIAEKIIDLANVNSGFDFEITDGKVFNVYSVQGSDVSESVVLEYGRNIKKARVIEDFKTPVNKAVVLGSAYGESDIQRVETDDLTKQGVYKVREQKYTEMDEVDTSNFTDRGNALIGKYGVPLLKVDISLVSSSVPLYLLGVGNQVRLIINDGYHNINDTYRIFEWQVTANTDNTKSISLVLGNYSL